MFSRKLLIVILLVSGNSLFAASETVEIGKIVSAEISIHISCLNAFNVNSGVGKYRYYISACAEDSIAIWNDFIANSKIMKADSNELIGTIMDGTDNDISVLLLVDLHNSYVIKFDNIDCISNNQRLYMFKTSTNPYFNQHLDIQDRYIVKSNDKTFLALKRHIEKMLFSISSNFKPATK